MQPGSASSWRWWRRRRLRARALAHPVQGWERAEATTTIPAARAEVNRALDEDSIPDAGGPDRAGGICWPRTRTVRRVVSSLEVAVTGAGETLNQATARTPPLHASDTLSVEAGTEVFNGCIDRNGNGKCGRRDHRGELRLAFLFWASFDADGLIKGQCVHPITGGSGAFKGARGVLKMLDRPVGDQVRTTYRGRIVLNAVPSEPAAAPVSTADGSTGMTTSTAPLRRAC